MRSSSQLFSVALTSAEILKDLAEDVYLLKHDRSTDKTVRVALTRVHLTDSVSTRPPVILMHGFFFNRSLWINGNAEGFAAFLARQGYDVWIPELRGHGLSPVNKDYAENTSEEFWKYDLPAVNDFVIEQTGQSPAWIGQGWGGLAVAASLALGAMPQERVRALAIAGVRISYPKRFSKVPGIHALTRWKLKRQGAIGGEEFQGPEAEPYGIVYERMRWTRRGGLWSMTAKAALWRGLSSLQTPFHILMPAKLSKVAQHDAQQLFQQWGSEDKQWTTVDIFGLKGEEIIESSSLVSGKLAEADTWPKLLDWLRRVAPEPSETKRVASRGEDVRR